MNPSNALGRHKLSTRFTSIVRICSIDYPKDEELQTIYGNYLRAVLQQQLPNHRVWGSNNKVYQLAGSMIQLYNEVCRRKCCVRLDRLPLSVEVEIWPRRAQSLLVHAERFDALVAEFSPLRFLIGTWRFPRRTPLRNLVLRSVASAPRSTGRTKCPGEIRSASRQHSEK